MPEPDIPRFLMEETHEVFNQPPPLENYNLFEQDQALIELMAREDTDWGVEQVRQLGSTLGQEQWATRGAHANKYSPEFTPHDRFGYRVDQVNFHPAYHELMSLAIEHDLHAGPWSNPQPGSHVVRLAKYYLYYQVESGTCCPITMTFACAPVIASTPSVAREWLPRVLSGVYDPANRPAASKAGATIGMAMTEKQGGTDVRANTSVARPLGPSGPGEDYEIVGHKWFCSAPMSDAFLVLANTDLGLSCFLLPRWRPDGTRNQMYVQRLKDKLGNKSNASSEIEFRGAYAQLLGEEGRGVKTIIQMVALTRYDCMIGSAALMRQAVAQASHHIGHRSVMGKLLIDQPLMQNVMADLCLEVEGALAMTGRVAHALDRPESEAEQLLIRLLTAVGKYWICKRAVVHVGESMECIGGPGYVEESVFPRLYREAPVNSIWEGSGNVQCLDVLRAMTRTPEVIDVFMSELETARGSNDQFDSYLDAIRADFAGLVDFEYRARHYVERLAKAMQAAQLIKAGNSMVSEAFCASRLGNDGGSTFGSLPSGIDCVSIIDRARPKLM